MPRAEFENDYATIALHGTDGAGHPVYVFTPKDTMIGSPPPNSPAASRQTEEQIDAMKELVRQFVTVQTGREPAELPRLVMDFGDIRFMDSRFQSVPVIAQRGVSGRVIIAGLERHENPTEGIASVFVITRLNQMIDLRYESTRDVVQSLSQERPPEVGGAAQQF